ncbi:hypothetical protein YC2023_116656 [Brassica napus]
MKEWWDLNISRLGGIRINGVSTGQDFCAFTPQIGDFSTDFLVTDGFSGEGFDEVIWIWSSSGYNFITARSVNNFFQKTYYLLKQQIWYVSLSLLDFIGVNQWRFSPDLGYVSESLRFAALNMNCFFSTRFGMWYMEIISKILSRIIDNPLIVSIYGDGICQDLLIGDSLVNRNLWIFLGVKSWRYGCLEFIGNMGESFSTSQHISLLRFTGSALDDADLMVEGVILSDSELMVEGEILSDSELKVEDGIDDEQEGEQGEITDIMEEEVLGGEDGGEEGGDEQTEVNDIPNEGSVEKAAKKKSAKTEEVWQGEQQRSGFVQGFISLRKKLMAKDLAKNGDKGTAPAKKASPLSLRTHRSNLSRLLVFLFLFYYNNVGFSYEIQ